MFNVIKTEYTETAGGRMSLISETEYTNIDIDYALELIEDLGHTIVNSFTDSSEYTQEDGELDYETGHTTRSMVSVEGPGVRLGELRMMTRWVTG